MPYNDPPPEERALADSFFKTVAKKLKVTKPSQIACAYERTAFTPCIVRDGSMCLTRGPRGVICVGCVHTLEEVAAAVNQLKTAEPH